MPIPLDSSSYQPASVAELRDRILDDMRLLYEQRGIEDADIGEGSDAYIRADASARADYALYAQVALARRDSSWLDAKGPQLDKHREAKGLPVVSANGAAGLLLPVIQSGATVTFFDGTEFRLRKSGKIGIVVGTQSGIQNFDTVVVQMTDKGADTNAEEGDFIDWLNAPQFVEQAGTVAEGGLVGGSGDEEDEEKRDRIRNAEKSRPGAGNAAHAIETAEGASTGVQKAFDFPCLGGPNTGKTVVVSKTSLTTPKDFSREVPEATLALVRAAFSTTFSGSEKRIVQSAADELTDVALQLALSASVGWFNATPWPPLTEDDDGRIAVTAVTDSTHIVISAQTEEEPEDGISKIAWWDPTEQEFVESLITEHGDADGGWDITISKPFTGVAVDDYVSPAAKNGAAYATAWLTEMSKLGPGENTNTAALLASDRGYRVPSAVTSNREGWPCELTTSQLSALIPQYDATGKLLSGFEEVADAVYSYVSKDTPTVPGDVNTAPNVLRLERFGIYKKI